MEQPPGELSRPLPASPLPTVRRPVGRRRPGPFVALALLAGTLAASFTLLAVRPPNDASAYDQAYNCETFVGRSTCSLTAGSWYTITNVGGTNYNVAGDICVQFGGVANSTACALGGYSILFCGNAPVHAYGISETFLGDDDNISGHEDNYTSCS
jgi:hypothetical protein